MTGDVVGIEWTSVWARSECCLEGTSHRRAFFWGANLAARTWFNGINDRTAVLEHRTTMSGSRGQLRGVLRPQCCRFGTTRIRGERSDAATMSRDSVSLATRGACRGMTGVRAEQPLSERLTSEAAGC